MTHRSFFQSSIRAREKVNIKGQKVQKRKAVAVRISTLHQARGRRQVYFWWASPNLSKVTFCPQVVCPSTLTLK